MYYLEMKTLINPGSKIDTFKLRNHTSHLRQKVKSSETLVDFKFYQKFFVILTALSTFLIFPETPKELESICHSYYSKQICNVW